MNEKQFFAFQHKHVNRLEILDRFGLEVDHTKVIHHYCNSNGYFELVLCQDQAYHKLLHIREDAIRYSGNVNWRKCTYCKQYDTPENLTINKKGIYHSECLTKWNKERYWNPREFRSVAL